MESKRIPHPNLKRCAFLSTNSSVSTSTAIAQAQISSLIRSGYRHFICSGRPGLEEAMANAVISLRPAYNDVLLEIVSHDTPEVSLADVLCKQADIVTSLAQEMTLYPITPDRYIVTNADLLLVFSDGSTATSEACDYAQGLGIPVYDLNQQAPIS